MGQKILKHKLLYELNQNARIPQKKLCEILKASPQQVNYTINKLTQDKEIKQEVIIDPAKFGQITILTLLTFTTFEKRKQTEILLKLKEHENTITVTQITNGADLLVEYIAPNLSFFNKIHTEILQNYEDDIKVLNVFPVIVQHIYNKKYLNKKSKNIQHKIIAGDRKQIQLEEKQKEILNELFINPTINITQLANKTNIDPRTAIKIKKELEKENIILGYTTHPNNEELKIKCQTILIKLHGKKHETIQSIPTYAEKIPEITKIRKLISYYDLAITVESLNSCEDVIKKIRDDLKIYEYISHTHIRNIKQKTINKTQILTPT